MKYQVNRKKLISFLHERPAMIKMVTKVTEELAQDILKGLSNYSSRPADFYRNLPAELKTMRMARTYMGQTANYRFDIDALTEENKKELTKAERKKLLGNNNGIITALPDPTPAEWLLAIVGGFNDLAQIPKDVWSKRHALAYIKKRYGAIDGEFLQIIFPYWDREFALNVVEANKEMLEHVPTYLLTNEVLKAAVQSHIDLDFRSSSFKIPDEAWDQEAADLACQCISNIRIVPRQFRTEELCIEAASRGIYEDLPFHTLPVLMAYAKEVRNNFDKGLKVLGINKLVEDRVQFALDIFKADGSLASFKHFVTVDEAMWLQILEINPGMIKEIEKASQTDAIIDKFFSVATPDVIDSHAKSINLTKVKSHHAPFLINCQNSLLVEVMNKFLRGDQESTQSTELIEIDLAPSEFSKIKRQLV